MPSLRLALVLLALLPQNVPAQITVAPSVTVQQLAPQLVAFAGSQANFESLVAGLSQGTAVQLVTTQPGGVTQVVSFTPAGALSPVQIAQLLEARRQQLIGLGIGTPTAEQLGMALMGGVVPTAIGGSTLPGTTLPASVSAVNNRPSPAAQMQSAASGASAPISSVSATGVTVQTFPAASPANAPAAIPGNLSDSPLPPGITSRSVVPGASVAPIPVPGAAAAATPPAPERSPAAPRAGAH